MLVEEQVLMEDQLLLLEPMEDHSQLLELEVVEVKSQESWL